MTEAEITAINEQMRFMTDENIHEMAKILFKYGFVIVRHGMPAQDYWR
jgi:hypothetical protein